MDRNNGGNGSKILWYLFTVAFGLVFTAAGFWADATNTDLREIRARVDQLEQHYASIDGKLDILLDDRKSKRGK